MAWIRVLWQRLGEGRSWPRVMLCAVLLGIIYLSVNGNILASRDAVGSITLNSENSPPGTMKVDTGSSHIADGQLRGRSGDLRTKAGELTSDEEEKSKQVVPNGESIHTTAADESKKVLENAESTKTVLEPKGEGLGNQAGQTTHESDQGNAIPETDSKKVVPEGDSHGSKTQDNENTPSSAKGNDLVQVTPVGPHETPKQWFDAGFSSQLPPLDYGMDGDPGPDGKRAYGKHPHYMPRCHACFHHKFMYVTLDGAHEAEIVRNLKIVMCAMRGLPGDCGEHFIEQDCSNFEAIDTKDWFIFSFSMDPHSRAITAWTQGFQNDIRKAKIPANKQEANLRREEKTCPFRSYVMWASGLDRAGGFSCPFFRPDHQYEALFTVAGEPALNYIGRIEYYNRDILAILKLIDPSGEMVKYHEQHAEEFGLHENWHPGDWREFYKDGELPDTWSLVSRLYKKDIEVLNYPMDIHSKAYTHNQAELDYNSSAV